MSIKYPVKDGTVVLSGSADQELTIGGTYLYIYDAAEELTVEFDGASVGTVAVRQGALIQGFDPAFTKVRFNSTTGQTVKFKYGYGAYSELVAQVEIDADSGSLTTVPVKPNGATVPSDVSLAATTSGQIIAANTARRSVTIKNLAGNSDVFRIGISGSIGATQGHELAVGESITLETTVAIHGYNAHSSAQTVSVFEETYS